MCGVSSAQTTVPTQDCRAVQRHSGTLQLLSVRLHHGWKSYCILKQIKGSVKLPGAPTDETTKGQEWKYKTSISGSNFKGKNMLKYYGIPGLGRDSKTPTARQNRELVT